MTAIAQALGAALLATLPAVQAAPMTLDDYLALRGPAPTAHLAYGPAASQYAELFRPAGAGPFPVVFLVHGGCWSAKYGGIEQMRNMAAALASVGIAVWNVEYRRVDEEGGGYPGMYLDINAAVDKLQAVAAGYQLDTSRVVAVGHSAGGQLVQWLAGRSRLPVSSPLYRGNYLPIRQIVNLGGLADLDNRELIRQSCDRDVAELTGTASAGRPDVMADTNAARLVPNGSTTVLINGQFDTIAPPATAAAYARLATRAGDRARAMVLPNASHYDEVAVSSPSWSLILPVIRQALGLPATAGKSSSPALPGSVR